jgi:hypothetical protein
MSEFLATIRFENDKYCNDCIGLNPDEKKCKLAQGYLRIDREWVDWHGDLYRRPSNCPLIDSNKIIVGQKRHQQEGVMA